MKRNHISRASMLVMTVVISACTPDRGSEVESAWDELERLPEIELVAELVIAGGEHDLEPVQEVIAGPAGVVAIEQRQAGAVRFFDSAGDPMASFGRSGEGPGEFLQINAMGWAGDTVWVWDQLQSRLTFFQLTSPPTLIRTVRVPVPRLSERLEGTLELPPFPLVVHGRYADGRLHVVVRPWSGDDSESVHARMTPDGTVEQVLARVPEQTRLWLDEFEAGFTQVFPNPVPFAMGPDGERAALAIASLGGAEARTFTAVMFGAAGDTVYSRTHPFEQVVITEEAAAAHLDRRAAILERQEQPPRLIQAFREEAAIPPWYPPFQSGSMVVGEDGSVWIQTVSADASPFGPYLVLSPTGEVAGRVSPPSGDPHFNILAVGTGWLWSITRDAYGVPELLRHSFDSPW